MQSSQAGSGYEPLSLTSIVVQIKKSKHGYFDQNVFIDREHNHGYGIPGVKVIIAY
jgi:hypothetical protein